MSFQWIFYSYSPSRFTAYFDGSIPDAAEQLIGAATWDEEAWEDPDTPARLVERITRVGICYDGLSKADATALDQLIQILFTPEGLAEQWEVVPESADGLSPSVVKEIGSCATGAKLMPILLSGRRFGEPEPSSCEYCFLSTDECQALADEITRALASGGPWSAAWLPEVVETCWIDPLRSALSKRRPLFGALG